MKDFLSYVLEKETLSGAKEHIHNYDLLKGFLSWYDKQLDNTVCVGFWQMIDHCKIIIQTKFLSN